MTPYEIAFPGRRFVEERFKRIKAEGERLGVELSDPGAFAMLSETGEVVGEIMADELEPGASTQTGALVFHGYHFWRAREPVFLATEEVARAVVERARAGRGAVGEPGDPAPGLEPPGRAAPREPPDPVAGYLQWPRHLFWTSAASEDGVPEPVDGFFWSIAPAGALSLLLIVGLRGGREGFGAVHLPAVSPDEAWGSLDEPGREGAPDFDASGLPGAEIEDLLSIETAVEAVKLAMTVFEALGDASEVEPGGGESQASPAGAAGGQAPADGRGESSAPIRTSLPWRRLAGGATTAREPSPPAE